MLFYCHGHPKECLVLFFVMGIQRDVMYCPTVMGTQGGCPVQSYCHEYPDACHVLSYCHGYPEGCHVPSSDMGIQMDVL